MTKRLVTHVSLFDNGMLAVCDQNGKQMGDVQGYAKDVLQQLWDILVEQGAVEESTVELVREGE